MLGEYYQFRQHLVEALERDLLGPGADDEVITGPPTLRYIVGVLFPRDSDRTDEAQDFDESTASGADADDSGDWDPAVSMSYVRYPCSMGMTMAVDSTAAERIVVHVGGARYVPVEQPSGEASPAGDPEQGAPEFIGRRAPSSEQASWRRIPLRAEPIEIDVSRPTPARAAPVGGGLDLFPNYLAGARHRANRRPGADSRTEPNRSRSTYRGRPQAGRIQWGMAWSCSGESVQRTTWDGSPSPSCLSIPGNRSASRMTPTRSSRPPCGLRRRTVVWSSCTART